jgi:hypothetical protein
MTPEILNHLSDLSARMDELQTIRRVIADLETCRETPQEINDALTLLRFVERLQAQAIAKETA